MLNDLDICNACGVVVSAHTRTIHWDFHQTLENRIGELEARVQVLALERDAAIDARREKLDRGEERN